MSGNWSPLTVGSYNGAPKISTAGAFVCGENVDASTGKVTAGRWSESSGQWQYLPTLGSFSGSVASSASDISGDGLTIAGFGWITPGSGHAFKWTQAGGTVDIDTTPGTSSNAYALSLDGSTVVGWDADGGNERDACIWKNGVATYPGSLVPGNPVYGAGECHGVNSDGTWVCGTSNQHAFRRSQAAGLLDLGQATAGVRSTATAISDDGTTVIGWSGSSALDARAVIWRPEYGTHVVDLQNLLVSLNVPGASSWTRMVFAYDLSPDGSTFAGWGDGPNANNEGFIVRLPRPPTPYCTSGTTSNGCLASISANVNPNIAHNNSCTVTVANVEGQKTGIVFYGLSQLVQPWCSGGGGSSFLCVKPPTMRTGVQSSGGNAGGCNGSLTLNWNAFQSATPGALGAPWVAGGQAYVQGWFRDPAACKTTSLSNALQLTYQP